MNNFVRVLSCLCLLVLFPRFCIAQERIEISTDPPAPMPKFQVKKEIGKAKVLYDERNNRTIIQTALFQVQGNWRNGIKLRAGFEVSGKEIPKPSSITLTFITDSSDRTYADNRTLKILIDGKEAFSSVAQYESGNTNGEVFLITLTQDVSLELFLQLIASKNLKMQIGPAEFELKKSDLDALKDLKRIIW